MLLLAALAAQAAPAPPLPKALNQATATLRIQRASVISSESWDRSPPDMRREVVSMDDQGRPLLLRLIENQ